MSKTKRAIVYFEPDFHKAVRMKAAASDASTSEVVDEAVKLLLAEDAEDLAALDARVAEPTVSFDAFVQELSSKGLI